MFISLSSLSSWHEVLEKSIQKNIVVLKHSKDCAQSLIVFELLKNQLKSYPELEIYVVIVQDTPQLSKVIEKDMNLRHETPQLIIFQNKKVLFHTSHQNINISHILQHI